eukprot:jgi/Chlat1/7318/Chrsp58S06947
MAAAAAAACAGHAVRHARLLEDKLSPAVLPADARMNISRPRPLAGLGQAACASLRPALPPRLRRHHAKAAPPSTSRAAPVPQTCRASAAAAPKTSQMLIYVPPHPLIQHWLAVIRNKYAPPPMFRNALSELGRLLVYEATRDWLGMIEGQVETPCGIANVSTVNPEDPIVVPILRAGIILLEQASTLLPASATYHVGFVRNEETLQPSMYLDKLPKSFGSSQKILVCDPMLATGGTMVATLNEIVRRGASVSNIRVVTAVCATPALSRMSELFPGLKIFTGCIDEKLNDKGYIVPGLGDAGDRAFGTL